MPANIDNHSQLSEFHSYWRDKPPYIAMATAGFQFDAKVKIRHRKNYLDEFITRVQITFGGYEDDGAVMLEETSLLTSERFHTKYLPIGLKYQYNPKDHTLTISGKSDKMMSYKVVIFPILRIQKQENGNDNL